MGNQGELPEKKGTGHTRHGGRLVGGHSVTWGAWGWGKIVVGNEIIVGGSSMMGSDRIASELVVGGGAGWAAGLAT